MSLEPYPTYMQGRERTARSPKSQLNTYGEFGPQINIPDEFAEPLLNERTWSVEKSIQNIVELTTHRTILQYANSAHVHNSGEFGSQINVEFGPQIYTPEERGTQINI